MPLITGIVIVLLILIIALEYDRIQSYTIPVYTYYVEAFPIRFIGIYNSFLRLFSATHPALTRNVIEWFPEHKILKNNWQTMRDEALNIYTNYNMQKFHEASLSSHEISSSGKWKSFILKWYRDPVKQTELLAPKTTAIVKRIPQLRSCMFSILEPYMHIPYHKGPYKGSIRYHLALKIPSDRKNCYIEVNDKKYNWTDGEDVIFDDTYKHCVYNNTDEIRIILFCDIDRPLIEPINSINKLFTDRASFSEWIKNVNDQSEKAITLKQ
jgi:beta-hydroxylase